MKSKKPTPSPLVQTLISLAFGVLIFSLVCLIPMFTQIGLWVRYNLVLTVLIGAGLLYASFQIRPWWGRSVQFGLVMALFALPLNGLWHSGLSEPFIIAGLLPFSDAAAYYSDALRVVEGYGFSAFSARRPLFPALLSMLLQLTRQNLLLSLAILSGLIAIACWIAARHIKQSHGKLAATVFVLLVYLFYRRIAGTAMTENLGLPLALVGFALLWSAAKSRKTWVLLAGILLQTLALNARAGTFFILPALVLWSGFSFREGKRFSWKTALSALLAVCLGFLVNFAVFKVVAEPGGMAFSNFSYTLYGLVAGGRGWNQILVDFPALVNLDDVARSAQAYQLAWQAFLAHPFNLVLGALKYWSDYVLPRGMGAFGFIRGDGPLWVGYAVRSLLLALTGLGVYRIFRHRSQPHASLPLWTGLGLFLSVPFVPPVDSNQMRVYAASVPFLFVIDIAGISQIQEWLRRKSSPVIPLAEAEPSPLPAVSFGLGVVILAVLGSILIRLLIPSPAAIQTLVCPDGKRAIAWRLANGASVSFSPASGTGKVAGMGTFSMRSFNAYVEGYPEFHAALDQVIENAGGDVTLLRPLDLETLDFPFLLTVTPQGQPGEIVSVCASPSIDPELQKRDVWISLP